MNHKSTVRNSVKWNHLAQEDGDEPSGRKRQGIEYVPEQLVYS